MTQASDGSGGRGPGHDGSGIGAAFERAAAAYRSLDARLAEAGGLGAVAALYDRVRAHVDAIDYGELDRVAAEVRRAIEVLLEMDAAVRKLNNLKLFFERHAGTTTARTQE